MPAVTRFPSSAESTTTVPSAGARMTWRVLDVLVAGAAGVGAVQRVVDAVADPPWILGAGMAARWAERGLALGLCARHEPEPPDARGPGGGGAAGAGVATAAGVVASMRGYRLAPLVWLVGMAIGAATAYTRIASDHHYFTDTLAGAAIGTVEDAEFLSAAFKDADAVYTMIPPGSYNDHNLDVRAQVVQTTGNYKHAIQQAGVKRVVQLSSIGGHMEKGNGILGVYFEMEKLLNELPSDVAITFMRPVGFYYNLFGFIQTIKTQGVIATNYGGDNKKPWVSPIDIAAAVAEELTAPSEGRKVRYVASDEVSCNELAAILGNAIGKPDLKWVVIPDEQLLKGMTAAGMNPKIAAGLVEMNACAHTGVLYEDYNRNRPALGKVKLTDLKK